MPAPSFATEIEQIQAFCRQHGIALFFGLPTNHAYALCRWNNSAPSALQDFLSALPVVGARLLHLAITQSEAYTAEAQAVSDGQTTPAKPTQAAGKASAKRHQKEVGASLALAAAFIHGGVLYAYTSRHVGAPLSATMQGLIGEHNGEANGSATGLQRPSVPLSDYLAARRTPKQKMDALARQIADDPLYIHARNKTERREWAKDTAKAEGVRLESDRIDVAKGAEQIFKNEKVEGRERERTKRVAALQRKNKKLKVSLSVRAMAKALNIPEDEMYKYMGNGQRQTKKPR